MHMRKRTSSALGTHIITHHHPVVSRVAKNKPTDLKFRGSTIKSMMSDMRHWQTQQAEAGPPGGAPTIGTAGAGDDEGP